MLTQIDPVTHSIHGLCGEITEDYRADVTRIEPLGNGVRRIYLRLNDDMPKPPGMKRNPTLAATVIVPEILADHSAYRIELWRRIGRGESLVDVTLRG
jgi:hypothetical protein